MSTQLIVRVEAELTEQVSRLHRAEGQTASEVVRDLLTQYVQKRDMAAHIDRMWARIGA